jgi:hypothetical protein
MKKENYLFVRHKSFALPANDRNNTFVFFVRLS